MALKFHEVTTVQTLSLRTNSYHAQFEAVHTINNQASYKLLSLRLLLGEESEISPFNTETGDILMYSQEIGEYDKPGFSNGAVEEILDRHIKAMIKDWLGTISYRLDHDEDDEDEIWF